MSSDEVSELLFGKLPGRKEWMLFYVELTAKHLHIYEGNDSPSVQRRHLRSLEVHGSDSAGEFSKDKRREYKFYYDRPGDGKYVFKCTDLEQRQKWVMSLQRHIQKQELLQRGFLPDASTQYSVASKPSPIHCEVPQPPPHRSTTLPRHHSAAGSMTPVPPPIRKHPPTLDKRDSGFVSGSGDFSRVPPHSNSGDSVIVHSTRTPKKQQSLSADGITPHKTPPSMEDEDLCRFTWYWGMTSRADCETMLKDKGVVGNFVVRMNDRGDYIMSFWRKDGIHHHKIQKTNDMYRFEKSAVRAEGFNLPDLLDTYMKHCTDRTIGPYGGQLYPNYDEVWSPPDIDFDQFGSKLKNIKEKSNRPIFSGGPGMGGRYGGKTLHEMKVEMEAEETGNSSSNSSLNETTEDPSRRQAAAPGVPNLAAVLTAGLRPNGVGDKSPSSSFKKKKPIPPPPIAMRPRREKKSVPQPPLTPTKPVRHASVASSSSSRHYANYMVQQQPQQQQEEEYNDEDETEEEYVVPSTLLKEEEESESIYQNYNYSEQTDRGGASYVNLQIGQQQQQDESLYANITYDGGSGKPKPIPPPKDVRRPRGGHRKM